MSFHVDHERTDWAAARAMCKGVPCRICGRTNDGCVTHEDGGTLCFHEASPRLTNAGYYHPPAGGDDGGWRERLAAMPPRVQRPAIDLDACDRAYRAILAACPLSDAQREAMLARGMTDDQILAEGYGTLAPGGRDELGRIAAEAAGDAVQHVPGLQRRDGVIELCAASGMLIPVRDVSGRVVGLRVRLEHVSPGDSRYRWVSSPTDETFAKVDGHTCHVALPPGWVPGDDVRRVIVTEGEIKAAITAWRMRIPVIAVPGVGNTGHVLEVVSLLTGGASTAVAVAYDADAETNAFVMAHREQLCQILAAAGHRVELWQWSIAGGKGLDDLIVNGLLPFPSAWRPPDGPPDGAGRMTVHPGEDPPAVDRLRQERDALNEHSKNLMRIARNKRNLGGDVAPIVAQMLYTEVRKWVIDKPSPDGRYRIIPGVLIGGTFNERGSRSEAVVSPGTFRNTMTKWEAAGLVPITRETEYIRKPGTKELIPRDVWVVDLGEENDLAALVEPLCTGNVYEAAGVERPRRGGARSCEGCGGTVFRRTVETVCVGCGLHAHEPKVKQFDVADELHGANLAPIERNREGVSSLHGANLASWEVEDDADELHGANLDGWETVAPRPAEPESLRMARAKAVLRQLQRSGHAPRLGMAGQLIVNEAESPMGDRLAGEVADYRAEIELWLLLDTAERLPA